MSDWKKARQLKGQCLRKPCHDFAEGRRFCRKHKDEENKGQKLKRLDRLAEGRCSQCYLPRGGDGTSSMCRPCADKDRDRRADLREQRVAAGLCPGCGGEKGPLATCRSCRIAWSKAHEERRKFKYA